MKPNKFLTKEQAGVVAEMINLVLGPRISSMSEKLGVDTNALVRYRPVGEKFLNAREKRGLTLKDAARKCKAPQYRLRAIEGGRMREIRLIIFNDYAKFLGIQKYVGEWAKANQEILNKFEKGNER